MRVAYFWMVLTQLLYTQNKDNKFFKVYLQDLPSPVSSSMADSPEGVIGVMTAPISILKHAQSTAQQHTPAKPHKPAKLHKPAKPHKPAQQQKPAKLHKPAKVHNTSGHSFLHTSFSTINYIGTFARNFLCQCVK